MTKISSYVTDDLITGGDKWIGSDVSNSYRTKNFTPSKLASYFNDNQIINIGADLQYTYYTLEIGEGRPEGTLTFETERGATVNFSTITTFLLSKFTTKENDVSNYFNFVVGSKILLYKSLNVNSFGYYSVTSIDPYLLDGNFYKVTVSYISGNGFMQEDNDYMISVVDKSSGGGGSQNLQQVTDIGASTTNPITINATAELDALNINTTGSGNGLRSISQATAIYAQSDNTAFAGSGDYGMYITAATSGIIVTADTDNVAILNQGSSAEGLVINSGTSSTGNFIELNKNGVDKLTVNQAGELTANKFIKLGGTSSQILAADGSAITAGTNITISGGTISASGGGGGGVTSITATSPITSSGGTTPVISTSMATNKLIGRSTAGTGVMEEIAIGSGLTLLGGTLSNTATPTPTGYYGAFQDNTIQTAAAINTPYAMKFGINDLSNGITIASDGSNLTRITIANTGIYNIQFSAQFDRTNSGTDAVDIWLRKNGVDVHGSAGKIILTGGAASSAIIAAWNYVLDIVSGDYYQIMWSTPDTHVRILYEAAQTSPFAHPLIPSTILTVTQQSGIMAGTGITAINSLTGAAQTLTIGTTGTDFAINSSGSTHKFNLPTASASNRGALSSANWTTFNGKQDALGYTPYDATNPSGYQTAGQVQTIADAKVADAINDGTTTVAPSQNAVFDALALKANIASPTFTGTPSLTTTPTAGDIKTQSINGYLWTGTISGLSPATAYTLSLVAVSSVGLISSSATANGFTV